MTPQSIAAQIETAFHAIYDEPGFMPVPVYVDDAGTETITVRVGCDINCDPQWVWVCEIDSDDDGFFRFRRDDCAAVITIPYPEN